MVSEFEKNIDKFEKQESKEKEPKTKILVLEDEYKEQA